jgi:hypothetical protein
MDAAIARQQCDKHISMATNKHATIEDAVFCVWFVPSLYNEDQVDKQVCPCPLIREGTPQ